jgi:hypothetical protein
MALRKVRHLSVRVRTSSGQVVRAYRGQVVDILDADIPGLEAKGAVVAEGVEIATSPYTPASAPASYASSGLGAGVVRHVPPAEAGFSTLPRTILPANHATIVSGRLHLVGINLPLGVPIMGITFLSMTTAMVTGTNQWFGIFDGARVAKRFTVNDGATAWPANTPKALALTSPWFTEYEGHHYLGIMVAAATVPSLSTIAVGTALGSIPPIVSGSADVGLTVPPALPFTAAALAATANLPMAWVW